MNGLTKIKGFAQFTMIMVGLIFFAGCKKENGDYAEAPSTRFDASINTSIVQYALSLASSLEDVECRNLVNGIIKAGVTAEFKSSTTGDVGTGMVLWWHDKNTTYESRDFLWEFVR